MKAVRFDDHSGIEVHAGAGSLRLAACDFRDDRGSVRPDPRALRMEVNPCTYSLCEPWPTSWRLRTGESTAVYARGVAPMEDYDCPPPVASLRPQPLAKSANCANRR